MLTLAANVFHQALVDDRGRFPELRRVLRVMQTELFRRARDKFSERRSELLECLSLVMRALLVRMDIMSLRVGWNRRPFRRGRERRARDFQGMPVRTIARWVQRDESSVKRALTILRWLGWVPGPGRQGPWVIKQPVELVCEDERHVHIRGCYRFWPGVRRVSLEFFEMLGLSGQLEEARAYKAGKKAEAEEERRRELAGIVPLRRPTAEPSRATLALVNTLAAHVAFKPPDG